MSFFSTLTSSRNENLKQKMKAIVDHITQPLVDSAQQIVKARSVERCSMRSRAITFHNTPFETVTH